MLIEDSQGNQFLELIALAEDELPTLVPLSHAVVVARHGGRTLLVFSRGRQHWELVGGAIDSGERARDCAVRELQEESGLICRAEALQFVGAMKFLFQPDKRSAVTRIEHGGLYVVDVDQIDPFLPNDEIAAVCWWDGSEPIGEISGLDRKIMEIVEGRLKPAPTNGLRAG